MMYYYNDYYDFFPFHIFGFVFMILFWGLIIYGLLHIFRKIPTSGSRRNNSRATEILEERYARGEITKEKFEEMKKDLK